MTRLGKPPVDYLCQCSNTSLRYFEMSKLEHAANLRRELAVLLDEMMEETALALLARWMLDRRSGRSSSAVPGGEPGGGERPAASELLVGWLSSARQVEGAAALPRGGNGRVRGNAPSGDPESSAGTLRKERNPPAPRDQIPCEPSAIRADRRAVRKAARAISGAPSAPSGIPADAGEDPTS